MGGFVVAQSSEIDSQSLEAPERSKCPAHPSCGCNGYGRVPGGMTAILASVNGGECPDWWPIKVYRPCDKFMEAGLSYKSAGQTVDDIFFGGATTTKDFLSGKDS